MNKEHREVKPIVHFQKFGHFVELDGLGRIAFVYGVIDHPRLGQEEVVRTSLVQEVDDEYSPTVIHTMNTIYKLAHYDEDGTLITGAEA